MQYRYFVSSSCARVIQFEHTPYPIEQAKLLLLRVARAVTGLFFFNRFGRFPLGTPKGLNMHHSVPKLKDRLRTNTTTKTALHFRAAW